MYGNWNGFFYLELLAPFWDWTFSTDYFLMCIFLCRFCSELFAKNFFHNFGRGIWTGNNGNFSLVLWKLLGSQLLTFLQWGIVMRSGKTTLPVKIHPKKLLACNSEGKMFCLLLKMETLRANWLPSKPIRAASNGQSSWHDNHVESLDIGYFRWSHHACRTRDYTKISQALILQKWKKSK